MHGVALALESLPRELALERPEELATALFEGGDGDDLEWHAHFDRHLAAEESEKWVGLDVGIQLDGREDAQLSRLFVYDD